MEKISKAWIVSTCNRKKDQYPFTDIQLFADEKEAMEFFKENLKEAIETGKKNMFDVVRMSQEDTKDDEGEHIYLNEKEFEGEYLIIESNGFVMEGRITEADVDYD